MQEEVGFHLSAEADDGRSVKRYSEAERPFELGSGYGDIFLMPVYVAEREAYKLYLFFLYILDNFFSCIFHLKTLLDGLKTIVIIAKSKRVDKILI